MYRNGKILVVDDDENTRKSLKSVLGKFYQILEAENGQEAFELFSYASENIAVVILDITMPQYDGYYFLEKYHRVEQYQAVPVIVATVDNNSMVEKKCLELGAWDFITKPYDPDVVLFRLQKMIECSRLQISRELKYRAEYDMLTEIYNKSNMFQRTMQLLEEYPDRKFAFIRMDIEKFQLINTFFGMSAGDELLKHIARLLRRALGGRKEVSYGRIEADIFGLCMPYQTVEELEDFLGRIRDSLSVYPLEYDIVPIFGIYLIDNRDISPDHMYDRANLAAKHCKGNYIRNYAFYSREMSEEIENEQRIVNSMKYALEKEEFVLYLQPKYELQKNEVAGAEVLVRWIHGERGMISPGEFIPVFERNGFITKLDYYVWEKTCQLLRRWLDEGRNPCPVSVNVSRVSLYNSKLADVICSLVDQYKIPRTLFQLELTESAYTSNLKLVQETMNRLQDEGFSVLMDDFGSGYSSLNVLKEISVDILKMDMAFLTGVDSHGRGKNIFTSVVRMAKWLNLPVIAEGVEKREQADFLRSIGCEYVQGFYFAKPMPVDEYEKIAFAEPYFKEEPTHRKHVDVDQVWSPSSWLETQFLNMQQGAAVYEYSEGNIEIIRVNNAYYSLFGYEDIQHWNGTFMVAPRYRQRFWDAFSQAAETEETVEFEFLRENDSGRQLWIRLRLYHVGVIGAKHLIYGIMTDTTEQKELEWELRKYRMSMCGTEQEKKTILVVDDLEINRVSLRSIFELEYCILEAENGKEALEVLAHCKDPVNLILLDIRMPVMDGTAFLKARENDPRLAEIPVCIITSTETEDKQAQAEKMGADDYIVRPYMPDVIRSRILNLVEAE